VTLDMPDDLRAAEGTRWFATGDRFLPIFRLQSLSLLEVQHRTEIVVERHEPLDDLLAGNLE